MSLFLYGTEYKPRVVQFISPPYLGNMVLAAGPAQFGMDLTDNNGVSKHHFQQAMTMKEYNAYCLFFKRYFLKIMSQLGTCENCINTTII